MVTHCLVLLETGGNQNYIFRNARMRDVIGASELTYKAGTEFVLQALGRDVRAWEDAPDKAAWLADEQNNPAPSDEVPIQLILLTSGKALALANNAAAAEQFIFDVTAMALTKAPGLDLLGAYVELPKALDDMTAEAFGQALVSAHKQYRINRLQRVDPLTRTPNFPDRAACESSGQPAQLQQKLASDEISPISEEIWCKRQAVADWRRRVAALLDLSKDILPDDLEDLDDLEDIEWKGLIHADGNGLGQIFIDFHKACPTGASARGYVYDLRRFSYALDAAVIAATRSAITDIQERHCKLRQKPKSDNHAATLASDDPRFLIKPFFPLLLGGDDLTAIVDGQQAIGFTERFIRAYEEALEKSDVVSKLLRQFHSSDNSKLKPNLQPPKLTTCAGLAIVKPKYPFLAAYELASELIQSAKVVKKKSARTSAFDFHILYDSTSSSLVDIRAQLQYIDKKSNTYSFTAKPLVVKRNETQTGATTDWCEGRSYGDFIAAIEVLVKMDDDGRRRLPTSQLHELRFSWYRGKPECDSQYQRINACYNKALEAVFGADSLFKPKASHTLFLDALEAQSFVQLDCGRWP